MGAGHGGGSGDVGPGTPSPCLLIPSRWGRHVSKPSSRGSRSRGTRQMASGEWGQVGTKGCLRPWGGAGWASSPPGFPSSRPGLMPHREFFEALGESRRFWGQAWAAGERGRGRGRSRGHTIADPRPGRSRLEQVGRGTRPGPSRPRLSLVPWGLGLSWDTRSSPACTLCWALGSALCTRPRSCQATAPDCPLERRGHGHPGG